MTMQTHIHAIKTEAEAREDSIFAKMQADTSYEAAMGDRPLGTVPVRKPAKDLWIRVHPTYSMDANMIELKSSGADKVYFGPAAVAALVQKNASRVRLRLFITSNGSAMLWPMRLPDEVKRSDDWASSALEIAGRAESTWIRVVPNTELGIYECFVARAELGEPVWPKESWPQILEIALKGRYIENADHAVIRHLLDGNKL